jgi:hypothetical protein
MKILTKKQEQEQKEILFRKLKFVANAVYEKTLVWCGNNDDAIPDKSRELKNFCDEVFYADDVINYW